MKDINADTIFTTGPFAEASQRALDFGPNIYFSYLFGDSIRQQEELEKEYEEALLNNDEDLAKSKRNQIDMMEGVYRLSLTVFEAFGEMAS